ncbi:NifB/NifX family molybdenum-iron cluster-binding protein [Telmatobacter bradus]|uniref:NifB/NifX family molybdenum-iron cluster-binding protein n=1 Tax=Telmatobacter bradus TaxID=474953 RepID=UPI003B4359D0
MIIAIPTSDGHLNSHFGHSQIFSIIEVNPTTREILNINEANAPEHQPGVLPQWLKSMNANVVITGNLGARVRQMLNEMSIEIISGAPEEPVATLASLWLAGNLKSVETTCACSCQH